MYVLRHDGGKMSGGGGWGVKEGGCCRILTFDVGRGLPDAA